MRVPQSQLDLERHLQEQFRFLVESGKSFDAGFLGEGKRLAHSIRILLHDTRAATSLLEILGIKNRLQYYDHWAKTNREAAIIFVGASMSATEQGFRYRANLKKPKLQVGFDPWWNGIAMKNDVKKISFSRRDLVLAVANTDGGSHVDLELEQQYQELSRSNGFGWKVHRDHGEGVVENGPELPLVRQCAWELQCTLSEQIPGLIGLCLEV